MMMTSKEADVVLWTKDPTSNFSIPQHHRRCLCRFRWWWGSGFSIISFSKLAPFSLSCDPCQILHKVGCHWSANVWICLLLPCFCLPFYFKLPCLWKHFKLFCLTFKSALPPSWIFFLIVIDIKCCSFVCLSVLLHTSILKKPTWYPQTGISIRHSLLFWTLLSLQLKV